MEPGAACGLLPYPGGETMKRSNRPWRSPLLALSVALLGGASVMACSTDLTLNPTLERPPDAAAALMPHAVGLYISPELRAYAHSAEPYYRALL
jgi:hypothetical protein